MIRSFYILHNRPTVWTPILAPSYSRSRIESSSCEKQDFYLLPWNKKKLVSLNQWSVCSNVGKSIIFEIHEPALYKEASAESNLLRLTRASRRRVCSLRLYLSQFPDCNLQCTINVVNTTNITFGVGESSRIEHFLKQKKKSWAFARCFSTSNLYQQLRTYDYTICCSSMKAE